ncbi:uncharacterized protein BCR38DRAFT_414894 [Pseudomassariella vexata]|uniref:Uncharacterized protein n=1 Tax=Pseudomassariella vexata TaxID=1141098 RepID=A0A1Y2D857_9PEZI|nr:uncharacterized protein BCR38DRAFT_414894 [Pseudomassariella vexata]ORY55441.1 hypothetical protein BCR38DRAFT_414894 [Pseudomassariella vexata]
MCPNNSKEPLTPRFGPLSPVEETPSSAESGSHYSFGRLSINLKMGDHAYLQPRPGRESRSMESSLPEGGRSSATPTTLPFTTQDMATSYVSVAPYNNYPISYDSPLPTPVSVAGSPSLADRSSTKMIHAFGHNGGNSQQLTPPGTSRANPAEWYNPQTHQMHSLETSHSPEDHGLAVSAAEANYWGSYGVSGTEAQDDMSPHMTSQSLFMPMHNVAPSALIRNPNAMMSSSPMPLAPAPPQVPILRGAPNPSDLGPVVTPMDNMQQPFGNMSSQQHPMFLDIHYATQPSSSRRNLRPKTQRTRDKKRSRTASRALSNHGNEYMATQGDAQAASTSSGQQSQAQAPYPKIQLKETAPQEAKHLFDLRCKYDHKKGKGMWDSIMNEWEVANGRKDRATLQMQITRTVCKHAKWPESEDRALREAREELDSMYYVLLLKIMREKGGCRAWDWKPMHVIKRSVELGLEEWDPELGNVKKSKKKRKQSGPSTVNLWQNNAEPDVLYDDQGLSISTSVMMSNEQEEQLFAKWDQPEPETPEPDPMQGVTEHRPSVSRASTEMELNQAQSERVAKQACKQLSDQLLGQQQQQQRSHAHNFGNRS